MMWVYMIKNKNEAFIMFKRCKALVDKGTERQIKVFRTDRGGEFRSREFASFCEDNGIVRHFTTPYTPQQNGVVERRNHIIVAMARNLLKQMNLPLTLWEEAIKHSVYSLNRLPTRSMSEKTPYEAWKGGKTRYWSCKGVWLLGSHETTRG